MIQIHHKIQSISRLLEKYHNKPNQLDVEKLLEVMNYLDQVEMDFEVMKKTRIGLNLNNIRKIVVDEKINSKVKKICKKWKKLFEPNIAKENGKKFGDQKPLTSVENIRKVMPIQTLQSKASEGGIRARFREMLAKSLIPDSNDEDKHRYLQPEHLAFEIEEEIFKDLKNPQSIKYRTRVFTRVSNLRDNNNPDFKKNCLLGLIPSSKIALMGPLEMASDALVELRKRYLEEGINDAQMSFTGGTTTSDIKCSNCKKCDVTYNQVQTRSADEPMTTFCLCNECGKRWKFC